MAVVLRPTLIRSQEVAEDAAVIVVTTHRRHPEASGPARLASSVHQASLDPLADVRHQAEQLRAAAEAEADAIRARAIAEAEGIREAARKEGEAACQAALETALEARWGAQLQALIASVETLNEGRSQLVAEFEQHGLDLALALAERIVRQRIAADPGVLATMLTDLLAPLQPLHGLTIRVHPNDVGLLESVRAQIENELERETLTLIADKQLAPGSFQCRFEGGDCDASLTTQLTRLKSGLAQQLFQGQPLG